MEDSTLPKILELEAVAEKKESTIVQLENVASEFEKSGAEWRQDAAKFENVQVTYKEFEKVLMTAVCDKLKTFMEDHNKGNQGQILNTEQANVLGTEITQVEDLKKKFKQFQGEDDQLVYKAMQIERDVLVKENRALENSNRALENSIQRLMNETES